MSAYTLDLLREQIVGGNAVFQTPFGKRHLFYADYTASGRGLAFIEEKLLNIMKSYANSHTEDDYTGVFATQLLKQAETNIKKMVNAGPHGKIISVGTGATAALERLQKIIGIYQAPMTRVRTISCINKLRKSGKICQPGETPVVTSPQSEETLEDALGEFCPVVFVGPYEHHSNELMWRESISEVVVIRLNPEGHLDLEDLENKLADPRYTERARFASFSAGSNITGIKSDVYEIARICHRHHTPVFFDFAAIAPYEEINMNKDQDSYFDAIFFSPHKFLGGPGASGILIFDEHIYRQDLAPTTSGGGTVDYVGFSSHDFSTDIEIREKPGTPGILQTIKSALVMELKEKIGLDTIHSREKHLQKHFFARLKTNPRIHFLGGFQDDPRRIPIISFNIKHQDRFLHPKFVTKLLNDLFGIQTRAGCSCAGPYGHILLDIDDEHSQRYRHKISQGFLGIKPGWVRINLHYTFSDDDLDFLIRAIEFVAENGHVFLQRYTFFEKTGEWKHLGFSEDFPALHLDNTFDLESVNLKDLDSLRQDYFRTARRELAAIQKAKCLPFAAYMDGMEELQYFYLVHSDSSGGSTGCCST